MFQRSLPTLRFGDYGKAAAELTFFSRTGVQFILKMVGSNRRLSRTLLICNMVDGHIPLDTANESIRGLLDMGVLLQEEVHEHCAPSQIYYRVNWKQIRQINKAISLL